MSTKANFFQGSSKRSKPTPRSNMADNERPEGTGDKVMEEIRKMNATLKVVAADVTAIKETTKELKEAVDNIQIRLGDAEQRISNIEDANGRLDNDVQKHDKQIQTLWMRVEDLENRSRRNNVRLVGLKENKEQKGKVMQYVERILSEGLGLTGQEFEIERAHRSMAPMPDPDKPPRTILIRFLRSPARDKVLQVCKEKRGIEWEGCKLSFFEDLTRELAEKRKEFAPVKRRLQELNVKHRLVYPATLIFTWKGQKKTFKDWKEADEFIHRNG